MVENKIDLNNAVKNPRIYFLMHIFLGWIWSGLNLLSFAKLLTVPKREASVLQYFKETETFVFLVYWILSRG